MSSINTNVKNHDDKETTPAIHSNSLQLQILPHATSTTPLLISEGGSKPPLAETETDDDMEDDRRHMIHPYPGADDGFFDNVADRNHDGPSNGNNDDYIPEISLRMGDEDDATTATDAADGKKPSGTSNGGDSNQPLPERPPRYPNPYAPSFGGRDFDFGSMPDTESIPDVNVYQHKKTLAQGMMDLALFSANANQLRYVLESFNRHPYYYPSMIMIVISLILQVAVGVGLIWNATYNVKDKREICIANRISNFTIIGIFLVTVINVFISAFGVANAPKVDD